MAQLVQGLILSVVLVATLRLIYSLLKEGSK